MDYPIGVGTTVPNATPLRVASVGDRLLSFIIEIVIYFLFIGIGVSVAIAYFVFDQPIAKKITSNEFSVVDGRVVEQGTLTSYEFGASSAGWIGWLLYCCYFVWFESRTGQTPGKRAFGTKVVDARTGNIPTVSQSIIRVVFFQIGMFALFIPSLIIMLSSDRTQRVGDSVAKTVVVYARQREAAVHATQQPILPFNVNPSVGDPVGSGHQPRS